MTCACFTKNGSRPSLIGEEPAAITEAPRGTHDDVGPDTPSASSSLIKRSVANANKGQDHRDFDPYGEYAQERPNRSVAKVFKNQSVEQGVIIEATASRRH